MDREVARANGIDPDHPQIPQELLEQANKVGKASRGDYPYVGIDFLKNTEPISQNFIFLESNINPKITAARLGLDPTQYSDEECSLLVMQQVASRNMSMPSS